MRSTRTYNWERKRVYVEIIRKGKAHKTKLRHVDGAETARAAGALIKQEFTVFKRKLVSQTHETWDRICFLVYVRIFINFTSGNLLRMFDWGRISAAVAVHTPNSANVRISTNFQTHKAPEFDPIIKPGRLKFGPIRWANELCRTREQFCRQYNLLGRLKVEGFNP